MEQEIGDYGVDGVLMECINPAAKRGGVDACTDMVGALQSTPKYSKRLQSTADDKG